MPGMTSGLSPADPVLVAAFRHALLIQLAVIGGVLLLLLLAHGTARRWLVRPSPAAVTESAARLAAEPAARRVLRMSFGILWIVDALLQAQPQMAGGLPAQIVEPVAAASPHWVQHVVNVGGTVWSYHPVQAAAASVWIQAGIGLWLIVAADGWWSRLAGLASVAWGLVVWVFGEAFGGIFAPGLSWLTGSPGAVLLYVAAGGLIVLPRRAWAGPRSGRRLLTGIGAFWLLMAVLQAWPGRGYWQGTGGTLTDMVQSMAQSVQPRAQSAMVSSFASFTVSAGPAVNAFAVVALGALGAAFFSRRLGILRVAVLCAAVLCLADWALVQDFGIPGGLGTDPNSMVPWLVLLSAGYLAVRDGSAAAVTTARAAPAGQRPAWRDALRPAAPGRSVLLDQPAPGFQLVSQAGQPVSLTSLRGKVVLLTFIDPVCVGCSTIAQELAGAGSLLDPAGGHVAVVAIAATAIHSRPQFIRAFDHKQGLGAAKDWLFLTGPVADLEPAWHQYEQVAPRMMQGMMVHSDVAFIIDKAGWLRREVWDPPAQTASAKSSFSVLLSDAARQFMA